MGHNNNSIQNQNGFQPTAQDICWVLDSSV